MIRLAWFAGSIPVFASVRNVQFAGRPGIPSVTKAKEIAGNDQPSSPVIQQAAQIVREATSGNAESIEIDAALREFAKLQKKLTESGKRIQTAFNAKAGTCRPMLNRKAKFDKRIGFMAEQVELLKEHIDGIVEEWGRTKKQVDE